MPKASARSLTAFLRDQNLDLEQRGMRGPDADSKRLWGRSSSICNKFTIYLIGNSIWRASRSGRRPVEFAISGSTSHARRHGDFAGVMQAEPLNFVQLTYNILDRGVEDRLLPLAADRGPAVIVTNLPAGGLFQSVRTSSAARMGERVRCA